MNAGRGAEPQETQMSHYLHQFIFGIYPYICLVVLFAGSLIRFDREQYTWKSDSSQLLRRRQLVVGSNLFHYGILVVVIGHFVGFLVPEWLVGKAFTPTQHQLLAMVGGGIAGVVAIIGLSILIYRRLTDPRILANSRTSDILIVLLLWLQLALGLWTVKLSASHMDGQMFELLSSYVKGVVTFQPGVASLLENVPLTYRLHIILGFTIFLITPFTRMVHIWSGIGSVYYLVRPYQIVRRR
jgi:nitrate reductase gamma subunit